MTDDEYVRRIAREAADRAVTDTLQRLGIDEHDWRETQQDLAYLRRFRTGSERVGSWVTKSTISILVGGIAWAIWEAIKASK